MQAAERFNGKKEVYQAYRPSYPSKMLDDLNLLFIRSSKVNPNDITIADIGAGTGIFSKLLLDLGFHVIAVEPNVSMAEALYELQKHYPKQLTVQIASAEQTDLADQSVDHIVCAQAFHWFSAELAKQEFTRIKRPDGYTALIWNQRAIEVSDFMRDYEQLFIKYDQIDKLVSYSNVGHKRVSPESLADFYGGAAPQLYTYGNSQQLDYIGLLGRIQSSSFSLKKEDVLWPQFVDDVKKLFQKHEHNDKVEMLYRTELYLNAII